MKILLPVTSVYIFPHISNRERVIKIAVPKEHPYSSHISRFAMFPSYHSPDDPDTGVRAASQPFLSPLVPNSAPDVTLLNKTIGGPYRREVLETPVRTQKKAVTFSGEHGFLDPLKGESQVFYPTPTKAVMPNLKLRGWDLSLPERTSNMLKNLERTHWLTSYQMDYTGSGPANPLKIDDFMEKLSNLKDLHRENSLNRLCNKDARNGTKECSKAATNSTNINLEKLTESRELPWSMLNPCILPRPPVLPDIGTMRGQGAAPGLLDLQDAFSKTDAHHNFNNSIKRAAVNLRDNVVTGKKHDFYGINCWYLHG
uniref:Uncharacterized protein n=1 Tax=Sphaeramia orbicularis TaxID=375764 RepID=A0A672ZCH2_9TELE